VPWQNNNPLVEGQWKMLANFGMVIEVAFVTGT
jgi:hypothetical protein